MLGMLPASIVMGVSVPVSGYAYITNQLADSVSVITIPGGELVTTIVVASNPAPIALCGETAVVTSADAHQITLINLKTLKTRIMDFGKGPFGVDCDERTAYIGDWFTHKVYPFALDLSSQVEPITVGHVPSGVLLDKARQRLYVANRDDDTLSVIDLSSGQLVKTLATGDAPYGLVLNPARNQLYVINVRSSDVTVINTQRLEVVTQWQVGEWPYCGVVTQDGSRLYVTNQEDATLSVLDTSSGKPVQTIEISEVPEGIDITPDQRYIVTVGWESGVIDIIDASTMRLVRRVKAGKGSRSFGHFITSVKPLMEIK